MFIELPWKFQGHVGLIEQREMVEGLYGLLQDFQRDLLRTAHLCFQ